MNNYVLVDDVNDIIDDCNALNVEDAKKIFMRNKGFIGCNNNVCKIYVFISNMDGLV